MQQLISKVIYPKRIVWFLFFVSVLSANAQIKEVGGGPSLTIVDRIKLEDGLINRDIEVEGENLWVTTLYGTIVKITPEGKILKTLDARKADVLGFDGKYLWTTGDYDPEILKIDTSTGQTIGKIYFPHGNSIEGLAWDGNYLRVLTFNDYNYTDAMDSVFVVDTASHEIVKSYKGFGTREHALGYDGDNFWLGNNSDLDSVVLIKTDKLLNVQKIYKLSHIHYPSANSDFSISYPIGIAGNSKHLWISDGSEYIYKVEEEQLSTGITSHTTDLNNIVILYPNPSKDFINIQLKQDLKISEVVVRNTLGQIMMQTINYEDIAIGDLCPGIYMIQVITQQGTIQKLFEKEQ